MNPERLGLGIYQLPTPKSQRPLWRWEIRTLPQWEVYGTGTAHSEEEARDAARAWFAQVGPPPAAGPGAGPPPAGPAS